MSKNFYIKKMGEKAKLASLNLSNLSIDKRNSVLKQFSKYLKTNTKLILNSNKKDISYAKSKKIKDSMIERLRLNNKKMGLILKILDPLVFIVIYITYLPLYKPTKISIATNPANPLIPNCPTNPIRLPTIDTPNKGLPSMISANTPRPTKPANILVKPLTHSPTVAKAALVFILNPPI